MLRFLGILIATLSLAACNEQATVGTPTGDGTQPAVISFSLLNADTGEPLEGSSSLSGQETVALTSLPTQNVTLRANTNPETVGSVRFDFGGSSYVDTSAPYTLSTENGWTPLQDPTVTATALGTGGKSGASLSLTFSADSVNSALKHYLYVFRTAAIDVFDIDQNHKLVKSLKLPGGIDRIWGATAHAPSHMLYISYHDHDAKGGYERGLLKYDLVAERVAWKHLYKPFVDSPAVTADGKTIFMSSGEATDKGDFWFVIDTADGSVTDKIYVFRGSHNTIVGLSGKNVYLGSVRYPYLSVADTQTHKIVKKIGPFRDGIRPFTVNGKETLAFVNVNRFLGFEVGDIATGRVLYSVQVQGFKEGPFSSPLAVQSHGVALTPDEKEVWVVDSKNRRVHLYDVTGLPSKAPVYLTSIKLPSGPNWVQFSRNGRFAYTSGGEVISTKTRQVIGKTSSAKVRIQIDFLDGVPSQAYVRYGLGYVTD